jgi:hypothetical protein
MQKICLIIDSPFGEFYHKNCSELRLFRHHNLLSFKYIIVGVSHTEKELKKSEQYFLDYWLDKTFYSPEPCEPEYRAIKSAIDSQCDLIILLGGDKELNAQKLRHFILDISLSKFESIFTYKNNEFVAYKVNTNGYKLTGVNKSGKVEYSGQVVSNGHFEYRIINEDELPRKDFA